MSDKLREAAQAALESTKSLSVCCEDFSHHPQDLHRRDDQKCPPWRRYEDALTDLEAALAEPAIKESLTVAKQEPVAWKHPDKNMVFWENTKKVDEYHGFKPTIPLYAAPPRREWVSLTDDDKTEIKKLVTYGQFETAGEYANRVQAATESKLKEKNGG